MKKYWLLALCMPLCLAAGCANSAGPAAASSAAPEARMTDESSEEIIVFAAASMQETLSEIQEMYRKEQPDVSVICNFDSSGTLKTQIEEGAPCDIFISAAQKQMDQLDNGADGEAGLHLIDPQTRINLLENKVTLVVPEGNPAGIRSFADLAEKLSQDGILLAIGNGDVPVGQYTERIFAYLGLDEQLLAADGKLSYGSNVKEVTTQVASGSVAAGIIYATDAFSAGLDIVAEATPEMCGQVIYPAAVLKESKDKEVAEAFLTYLTTPEAMAVFESVGFSPAADAG